jgi:DNA-binding NtrC family response regulator
VSDRRTLSTLIVEGADARLEFESAELRVVAGPDRGAKKVLEGHSLLIGSAPECDLVLHDRLVSARHAELVSTPKDGYVLRDLESKNGLFLQGWPVQRVKLCDRMRIDLGESALTVHALGGRTSRPLAEVGSFAGLVAHSAQMRALVATLAQLGPSDAAVLIEGETGAGKEVVAQALHAAGPRRSSPFAVFDCGATSKQLWASELFGHERGAFTGADRARAGLLGEAGGGTLLLDEIGELPLELQASLLGVLERKSYRPVGGDRDRTLDARILAASHRNLEEEVRRGRFRADLYYRLSVVRLRVPPLRERREDIVPLAEQFARATSAVLTPEVITMLTAYSWPGNVRELKNTITRLSVQPSELALGGEPAAPDDLPLPEARRQAIDVFERRYLERVLARAGGSISRAAELAGVQRSLLTRLVAKHGMRVRDRSG